MDSYKFRKIGWIAALFLAFQISGCSLFAPKVALDHVTVDVEPRANNDTPIAIDFVVASDTQLFERLKATPASQWFEQRAQLARDYPNMFSVWRLEVVPGQFLELKENPLKGRPGSGLLLFASYNTPGAHRLLVEHQPSIWLRLGAREMRLLDAQGQ